MASLRIAVCILLIGVICQQVSATVIKTQHQNDENSDSREANDIIDSYVDEDEKSQSYIVHEATTKKQGIIENIVNKLGALKPKPIAIQNPLKKPLADLQEYLKPKPAPVITRTKTVKLEVTKVVTKHPICVASVYKKPACSAIHHDSISYKENEGEISRENIDEEVEELLKEAAEIKPSIVHSQPEDLATSIYESEPEARSGRFLKFGYETPAIESVKSVINEQAINDDDEAVDEGRHLYLKGETKYVTKTIWATKVQTTTDYKVTATLVPENCVPLDLYFPQCSKLPTKPISLIKPLLWKEEEVKHE